MEPALAPGDRLLVVRCRPRPGDVVALPDPRQPARTIVKRVVGVEGDTVTVAGDNAAASTDSRAFGPVPRRSVLGRAIYRYAPRSTAGWLPSRRGSRRRARG
jgi:mitochondrial inner membrane protease subunit 1